MQVVRQHGSREIGHGWASQYWQGKEPQKSCELVQSAENKIFSVAIKCEYLEFQHGAQQFIIYSNWSHKCLHGYDAKEVFQFQYWKNPYFYRN